jgi:DNA-binding transcriptional regulator YiaG
VKRNTTPTPTPDKAGSRATSIAHFHKLIVAWRKRRGLTRPEAARLLCCAAGTLAKWERRRSLPQGFSLPTIVAAIKGGAL